MLLLNLRLWADDGMYDDTALVEHFLDVQLTRRDLSCMRHIKHLNDEALNFYFKVLQDTITRDNGKCLILNTHFYNKLMSHGESYPQVDKYNYENVKRWYKSENYFSIVDSDKVLVPIHKIGKTEEESHWYLAVIDIKGKDMHMCDSIGGGEQKVLTNLKKFIKDEFNEKKPGSVVKRWKIVTLDNIPKQDNGHDCGVFMATYADLESRNLPFNFGPADIPLIRRHIVAQILSVRETTE